MIHHAITVPLALFGGIVVSATLLAQGAPANSTGLTFDVASIKRNTDTQFPVAAFQPAPPGEYKLPFSPVRTMILRGWPVATLPPQVRNLPSWAETDRYDVIARGKPNATPEEQQQMWRALLTERLKLAAHYETEEQAAYRLVVARPERGLGPNLKPTTLDCTASTAAATPVAPTDGPLQERARAMRDAAMQRCHSFYIDLDQTMVSGGAGMAELIRMITPAAGRTIVDATGLSGDYAVSLRFQRLPRPPTAEPAPDAPPALFTALEEQLGLKLENTRAPVQILVVDHIERPSEN